MTSVPFFSGLPTFTRIDPPLPVPMVFSTFSVTASIFGKYHVVPLRALLVFVTSETPSLSSSPHLLLPHTRYCVGSLQSSHLSISFSLINMSTFHPVAFAPDAYSPVAFRPIAFTTVSFRPVSFRPVTFPPLSLLLD